MNYSNYRIIHDLGQGGMAKVYLAEHKSLGHKVAIKVLNKEFFYNDNIRRRFLAEARSLAGMNHPNIVRVTDLIEENDSAAFVMEYIEGRTLRDYLEEKGKLPDDEIKHLFGQMLEAVGYVHEQGLIHRDIKPSNFMLDGRGNIKLLDFGIAKATDTASAEYTQTGTGVQMGTPMYMSPEQVKESRSVTAQSDIYSLGVVLYQMVSGKKPYEISTLSDFDLKTKIVNEPLKKTGSRWDTEIQKATAKDIVRRFKSCNDWKNDFVGNQCDPKENAVNETEKTIVETGRFSPIEKPKQKTNRTILFAGIGVLSLLMVLVFWQLLNSNQTVVSVPKSIDTISSHSDSITKIQKKDKAKLDTLLKIHMDILSSEYEGEELSTQVKRLEKLTNVDNYADSSKKQVSKKPRKINSILNEKEVVIADQVWMSENLNTDRFRNGDLIVEARTEEEWYSAWKNRKPVWCYYENKTANGRKYGKLYNWFVVSDPRGLAPKGWHIPKDTEWKRLINNLGGDKKAGKKIQSRSGWLYGIGANSSSFTGVPGGSRFHLGESFFNLGECAYWWSSSEYNAYDAWHLKLVCPSGNASFISIDTDHKNAGFSVRCIRD